LKKETENGRKKWKGRGKDKEMLSVSTVIRKMKIKEKKRKWRNVKENERKERKIKKRERRERQDKRKEN
jgi:hypothetical protein